MPIQARSQTELIANRGPNTLQSLIGDQLYSCTVSVSSNMIEAALHWLEYLDCADRDSDRLADAVQQRGGQFIVSPPPPRHAMDQLSRNMVVMHIAGMARALSAALDCLAGTIIGVLALPTPILKADLDRVRKLLGSMGPATTDGQREQTQFAERFKALIASSGPSGWLDWMLAFRNMLVHRGRRFEMGQFPRIISRAFRPEWQSPEPSSLTVSWLAPSHNLNLS